jgi:hypothetical protein
VPWSSKRVPRKALSCWGKALGGKDPNLRPAQDLGAECAPRQVLITLGELARIEQRLHHHDSEALGLLHRHIRDHRLARLLKTLVAPLPGIPQQLDEQEVPQGPILVVDRLPPGHGEKRITPLIVLQHLTGPLKELCQLFDLHSSLLLLRKDKRI